jgi:DNA-binding CsgD family transcriptional regulator
MSRSSAELDTQAFLHTHGIRVEPKGLDVMLEAAVAHLQRALYRSDPRADLTPAEAEVLEQGGFAVEPENPEGEQALARTAAEYAALLKTGLTTAQAATRLGVSPSSVRQQLSGEPRRLFGIRLGSGWVVPAFQFEGDQLVPGIAEVIAKLDPELHPVAVYRWFTSPDPDLLLEGVTERPLSPLEWLRAGLPPEPVAALAGDL